MSLVVDFSRFTQVVIVSIQINKSWKILEKIDKFFFMIPHFDFRRYHKNPS